MLNLLGYSTIVWNVSGKIGLQLFWLLLPFLTRYTLILQSLGLELLELMFWGCWRTFFSCLWRPKIQSVNLANFLVSFGDWALNSFLSMKPPQSIPNHNSKCHMNSVSGLARGYSNSDLACRLPAYTCDSQIS